MSQIKINPVAGRITVNHNEEAQYMASFTEPQKLDFREINLDYNKHYIAFVKLEEYLPLEDRTNYTRALRDRLKESGIIQDNVVFIPYSGKLPEFYVGEFSLKEVNLNC